MIEPERIEQARAQAEAAVAHALKANRRPRISDLLLLDVLRPEPRLLDRIRATWFPLAVVAVSLFALVFLATMHPPVTLVKGRLQTTHFALDVTELGGLPVLELASGADALALSVSGYASADAEGCTPQDPQEMVVVAAQRASLSLTNAGKLSLQIDPVEPNEQQVRRVTLRILTDAPNRLTFTRLAQPQPPRASFAECAGADLLYLQPSGDDLAEIEAEPLPVSALPHIVTLPSIGASAATFGRHEPGRVSEACALTQADFHVIQAIPWIGPSTATYQELPRDLCMSLPQGTTITHLSLTGSGTAEMWFKNGLGKVPQLDDGKNDAALMKTYLQVLLADPTIEMTFGAVAFILTTVWGAAAFTRELLK